MAAGAEMGARPGPVHDEVARIQHQWRDSLGQEARAAAERGELPDNADPDQTALDHKRSRL